MNPGGADEEVLDTRPPRPARRRWAVLLAGALAAAALIGVLVQRGGRDAPAPSRSAPDSAFPSRASLPPAPAAGAVDAVVVSAEVAFDRIGDTLYALDGDALVTIDLNTGVRTLSHQVEAVPAEQHRLLIDQPRRLVWLVAATGKTTVVDFLDPGTLARTGAHTVGGRFVDAAALDGRLYIATSAGVFVVSQSSETAPPRPPAVSGAPLALASDPRRHRLLVVEGDEQPDGRPQLSAWTPGASRPTVRAPAPFAKGSVAAAGGQLWAAGFGLHHGVLVRLDPTTLRVVRHSPIEGSVGVGAIVVAADPRYLLVRSGGGTVVGGAGADLWCVDAAGGGERHRWTSAPGTAVLTGNGVDLLQAGNPLIRLSSSGCRA